MSEPSSNPDPELPEDLSESTLLNRPLSEAEHSLLRIIFSPLYMPTKGWPVWDWVSREFYKQCQSSAEDAFVGLPTVQMEHSTYGLIWRSERNPNPPLPRETVGLSVAGLRALDDVAATTIAGWLVATARAFAGHESNLITDPYAVATATIDLGLLDSTIGGLEGMPIGLPVSVALQVIQREPAMPTVTESGNKWTASLHAANRALLDITDVDSYVNMIENAASVLAARQTEPFTPLSLPTTIDYFLTVARTTMQWGSSFRFGRVTPSAQLALEARTREEFSDRMVGLYDTLNSLQTPALDGAALKRHAWRGTNQPPTMQRMEFHLADKVGADLVREPFQDLRAVLLIRHSFHHPSLSKDVVPSYVRLGVQYPIRDWSAAWTMITFRTARAFDALREALQSEAE